MLTRGSYALLDAGEEGRTTLGPSSVAPTDALRHRRRRRGLPPRCSVICWGCHFSLPRYAVIVALNSVTIGCSDNLILESFRTVNVQSSAKKVGPRFRETRHLTLNHSMAEPCISFDYYCITVGRLRVGHGGARDGTDVGRRRHGREGRVLPRLNGPVTVKGYESGFGACVQNSIIILSPSLRVLSESRVGTSGVRGNQIHSIIL